MDGDEVVEKRVVKGTLIKHKTKNRIVFNLNKNREEKPGRLTVFRNKNFLTIVLLWSLLKSTTVYMERSLEIIKDEQYF